MSNDNTNKNFKEIFMMAETQQIHKTKVEPKEERIVRILSKDLEGGLAIYPGLAKIKGVSWSLSNAVCNCLNLDKKRKIGSLSEKELEEISVFIKNPNVPDYMKNRRRDFEKGESKHLIGTDLDLRKDFDMKNKREIWKAEARVSKMRSQAKELITASPEKQDALVKRLQKQGFNVKNLSDILSLTQKDWLERRLQTIVLRKKLANTPRHSRQLIVHKKIL